MIGRRSSHKETQAEARHVSMLVTTDSPLSLCKPVHIHSTTKQMSSTSKCGKKKKDKVKDNRKNTHVLQMRIKFVDLNMRSVF